MMRWLDIELHPAPRKLRQFSALLIIFSIAAGIWIGLVGSHTLLGIILVASGVTAGFVGLLSPPTIAPIFVGMMIVAFPIRWIVSQIALALLFYLVFTPLGLYFRLKGRDPLDRQFDPDKDSYWIKKPMPVDIRRYFKQI